MGGDLAAELVQRGKEIVALGIEDPEIFELIGLFQEGVGPDLLSDIAIAILRDRFLDFTGRITRELDLKPQRTFRFSGRDWVLPLFPDGKRPLILVPSALLSELPIALDRSEIDEVAAFNAEVRAAWNAIVALAGKEKRNVTKREIRELLLASPKNLKDLIEVYRRAARKGYDFEKDPDGLFSWDLVGRSAAETTPLSIALEKPANLADIRLVVDAIVAQFKRNVEDNKLYEVLYKEDGSAHREVFAQRLFFAVADAYCGANNVDLSREPDAGNGPVDFKLSAGYRGRVLVEVKKSTNPSLLHGFDTQLRAYEKAEATEESIYLILRVSEGESTINDVLRFRAKQAASGKRVPDVVVIDARIKASASKRVRVRDSA